MPDNHVLDQPRLNVFRIARHVVIPVANNSAGVSYRTALINSGIGGTTVLKDGDGTAGTIAAAEKTAIQAGQLYEVVDEVQMPDGLTTAQQIAYLDETYARRAADVLTELQQRLHFYGATRDTPGQGQGN